MDYKNNDKYIIGTNPKKEQEKIPVYIQKPAPLNPKKIFIGYKK